MIPEHNDNDQCCDDSANSDNSSRAPLAILTSITPAHCAAYRELVVVARQYITVFVGKGRSTPVHKSIHNRSRLASRLLLLRQLWRSQHR
jgi:hypothetical protein